MISAKDILAILGQHKIPVSNEKVTQLKINQILRRFESSIFAFEKVEFVREFRLDDKNIIDFLVNDHIGIEVKIGGSAKDIYRQLERYTAFDQIKEIILVTSRTMGLPPTINNKPVFVLNLSKAWL